MVLKMGGPILLKADSCVRHIGVVEFHRGCSVPWDHQGEVLWSDQSFIGAAAPGLLRPVLWRIQPVPRPAPFASHVAEAGMFPRGTVGPRAAIMLVPATWAAVLACVSAGMSHESVTMNEAGLPPSRVLGTSRTSRAARPRRGYIWCGWRANRGRRWDGLLRRGERVVWVREMARRGKQMSRLVILAAMLTLVPAGCGKEGTTKPPPTGACCASTGTCAVTTQDDCATPAVWHSAWAACSPNPCPQPQAACCSLLTGSCTVTVRDSCAAPSTWHAEWSTCSPNPCTQPIGACCAPAGTCTVTMQAACSGTWTAGGVCTPNPCTRPNGSCCAANGTCAVTPQAQCTGTWTMFGTCTPNPCPQPLPGMVWIPAGTVRLGQAGVPNAEPVTDFFVEGFYIARYEVSNAKYKAFIDAGGYGTEAYWNRVGWAWKVENGIALPEYWNDPTLHGGGIAGNEQFPVIGVSWWEASAYCRWAGGRLPSEAEWEKAAKGGCETHGDTGECDVSGTPTYPWGEGISGQRANYADSGDPYENNGWTTPVGFYDGGNHGGYQTIDSPSPYGLYDVAGNVREWCSTKRASYPYNPNDGRENPPATYDECCRVLRGGSWGDSNDDLLRCAARYYYAPHNRNVNHGFRLVMSE
jgi:formylglycine-generating enzyme required for sulfatase activity